MKRHHLLPQTIVDAEQLANWLQTNARETYKDESKILYSENELNDRARQSSGFGSEIVDLKTQLETVKSAVEKGVTGNEPLVITIFPTSGTKVLEKKRGEMDTEIKRGYRMETRTIYGIPDTESKEMVFFDIVGNEVKDRRRALSAREKHEYCGIFMYYDNGESSVREAI